MVQFTVEDIKKAKDYTVKYTGETPENLDGHCYICGGMLAELDLPEGPEKEVTCLEHRNDFIEFYNNMDEFIL